MWQDLKSFMINLDDAPQYRVKKSSDTEMPDWQNSWENFQASSDKKIDYVDVRIPDDEENMVAEMQQEIIDMGYETKTVSDNPDSYMRLSA